MSGGSTDGSRRVRERAQGARPGKPRVIEVLPSETTDAEAEAAAAAWREKVVALGIQGEGGVSWRRGRHGVAEIIAGPHRSA